VSGPPGRPVGGFGIIDEREADGVRDDAVESWLRAHPSAADPYLSPELERASRAGTALCMAGAGPRGSRGVCQAGKDLQLPPEVLAERWPATAAKQARPYPVEGSRRCGWHVWVWTFMSITSTALPIAAW